MVVVYLAQACFFSLFFCSFAFFSFVISVYKMSGKEASGI